jgi:pyruvate/2-oxoglutarate dehydrogenase complex dihydrolipoamide acyltransferase (E2) component
MRDGMAVCQVPAYFECLDADMTEAKAAVAFARSRGIRLTYTHIFVKAAAQALSRHADLHQLVCGQRIYNPAQVDIALSVAGEGAVAPLMVLEAADRKNLAEIGREITRRAPEVRDADRAMTRTLGRWGWIAPASFLRKAVLRTLFRSFSFRRKGSGTFQVSILSDVDQAMSPAFSSTAMLVAGRVRDRVVAVGGSPEVRPIVTLTCCADHRVWDGRAGQRFLTALREILESAEFYNEIWNSQTTEHHTCLSENRAVAMSIAC